MIKLLCRWDFNLIVTLMTTSTVIPHIVAFQRNIYFSTFRSSMSFCVPVSCNENNADKKTRGRYGSTCLSMGKMRNKQADLQRKMMMAKQQAAQKGKGGNECGNNETERMTDEEIKERNDRKRFEELLKSHSISNSDVGEEASEIYLSQEQEEENIDAYRKFSIIYEIWKISSRLIYDPNSLPQSHILSCAFAFLSCKQGKVWIDCLRETQHLLRCLKNWFPSSQKTPLVDLR